MSSRVKNTLGGCRYAPQRWGTVRAGEGGGGGSLMCIDVPLSALQLILLLGCSEGRPVTTVRGLSILVRHQVR